MKDPVSGLIICRICGKSNQQKDHIRSHLETFHFAGQFAYSCHICGKTYSRKNSLSKHMCAVHPDLK